MGPDILRFIVDTPSALHCIRLINLNALKVDCDWRAPPWRSPRAARRTGAKWGMSLAQVVSCAGATDFLLLANCVSFRNASPFSHHRASLP
jgi:hypothetical protein